MVADCLTRSKSRLPPKAPWKKLNISFFLFDGATPIQPKKGFKGTLKSCKCSYELSLSMAKPARVSNLHFTSLNFLNSLVIVFGSALDEKLSVVKAVERFKSSFVIVTANTSPGEQFSI